MGTLTAAKRKAMPKKDFAGPDKSFPDNDPKHQRLAISGATRSYNAGNISKGEETRIQARERSKLGISAGSKAKPHAAPKSPAGRATGKRK